MDSGTASWQMWSRDNICSLNERRCRSECVSAFPVFISMLKASQQSCVELPVGFLQRGFPGRRVLADEPPVSVCICAGFELLCLFLWNCIVTVLWFVWVVSRLCVFATERDRRYHFDDWTLEIVNVSRRDGGDYIIECSNAEGKNRTKLKLDVQCEELKTNSDTASLLGHMKQFMNIKFILPGRKLL